jgi:hypothetical protein
LLVFQVAEHAHDRHDPAAGADEQQTGRGVFGQDEAALNTTERDDRARAAAAHEVRRDLAVLDLLTVMLMRPSVRPGSEVSE